MKEYKSKLVLFVSVTLLLTMMLVPCMKSGVNAAEFELKFGALNPETLYMAKIAKSWMAKVEKETNGRVHFTPYWGTLLTPFDAPDEVARGVVDVANFSPDYPKVGFDLHKNSGTFWYGATSLPATAKLFMEVRKKFPEVDAQFDKYGKLMADDQVMALMHLFTKKPVRTLSDVKGMKIKATVAYIPLLKELGAEPVMMSMFECYLALQKGTIDGILSPMDTLVPLKFIEIVKYITLTNLTYPPHPGLMMNWNTWKKLPPDIQKVFENNMKFYSDENIKLTIEINNEYMAAAKKAGIQFVELSKDDTKKIDDIIYKENQKNAADLDAKKLPGTAMLQFVRKGLGK
jgi:TRAP-type C4-dicarboxylate transport system substrate-binding protein